MRTKTTKTVKLAEIKANLFVREELDQEWALTLAGLIENGVEMRDLMEVAEVDGELVMVDGRHRSWGYSLNDIDEVKVKVLEFDDKAEMIAYAFNKNKGSKPPTTGDTEHTIRELGKTGAGIRRIAEMLELPSKLIQKYLEDIKAKEKLANLRRGEELVRDSNVKVSDAAEQVGVKLEELRGFLGGHRRRKGEVADVQRQLTRLFQSNSAKVARLIKKIFKQFEVGDMSKSQVSKIFDKLEGLQKRYGKTVADSRARFDALSNGAQEAKENRESA